MSENPDSGSGVGIHLLVGLLFILWIVLICMDRILPDSKRMLHQLDLQDNAPILTLQVLF